MKTSTLPTVPGTYILRDAFGEERITVRNGETGLEYESEHVREEWFPVEDLLKSEPFELLAE